MNYQKIYNQIIERAKNRKLTTYKEKHHIIPRCMGGGNEKENIAELTAKEHYMCHKLLVFIYPDNNKLKYALWCMCTARGKNQERYKVSARIYEQLKIESAKLASEREKGKVGSRKGAKHTEETKAKMKVSRDKLYASGYVQKSKGKKRNLKDIWIKKGMSEQEVNEKILRLKEKQSEFMKQETNPFKTLEQTPERRQMLSERAKETFTGTKQSEEHKGKRSEAYKETCRNYSPEQKEAMSKRNKEKAQLQKIKQYKDFIITYNNETFEHKGNYSTISLFFKQEFELTISAASICSYLRGNTNSFKAAPGLTIKIQFQ